MIINILIISNILFLLLILFLFYTNYKIKKELEFEKSKDREYEFKRSFAYRELLRLQNQISIFDKIEKETMVEKNTIGTTKIAYNPIFEGKKALIGNYDKYSSEETRKILRSFGFEVDVVRTGTDIVDRIKNNMEYDIIFTNNIYEEGLDGVGVIKSLKQIEGFNTPIVIHTITEDAREHFINDIGFDEYIEKPIFASDKGKIKEFEKVVKKVIKK